ncbi:MAG: Uma2 family endonuclease [Acidobacteria bacterium]|nr:Uma2 family endonuclease [Acidobacteriota bacterium]MBI3426880.1 Uma2 family endonuclease [Acidobacteriota bacterium]
MTATTQAAFEDDLDYEIVDGQKEAKMAGAKPGSINAQLIIELGIYLKQNPIGKLYTSNTTFQIGVNERMPDVGFVFSQRIPAEGEPSGKWKIAPDLAIEVISPNDVWDKVNRKVREYFAAGVQQVWLVSQVEQEVTIYDSPTRIRVVTADQELTSEALLPGFKCRVSALFRS